MHEQLFRLFTVSREHRVAMVRENSAALGAGWRLGFLGLLHMDVFTQRLEVEFGASSVITSPNVCYKGG
jgi:translation elongation factor EF-4